MSIKITLYNHFTNWCWREVNFGTQSTFDLAAMLLPLAHGNL